MRLWHKDLIPVLPRQQLLGQWRECCLIARGLFNDNLNHLLVNPVKYYPITHFAKYCDEVRHEMLRRGYAVKTVINFYFGGRPVHKPTHDELFKEWHNERYFWQCYFNLQEKYDRGGISPEEWSKIELYKNSQLKFFIKPLDNSSNV